MQALSLSAWKLSPHCIFNIPHIFLDMLVILSFWLLVERIKNLEVSECNN